MKEIFSRNVPGTTEILQKSIIGVAGCGGLGSNIAVSLTRAGAGTLILVDFDRVELSNLNRQHFFLSHVGKKKVYALEEQLKNINPDINLIKYDCKITPEKVGKIFGTAHILIEAFDKAESKKWLIESWIEAYPDKPIICGNGLSGYGNTDELKVRKIGNIYLCGDGRTDMTMGLCASRVAIAANMEANVAIEILCKKKCI